MPRESFFERWDAHNQMVANRAAGRYETEVAKRQRSIAQRSAARRRRADRTVETDGRRLWVKARPSFSPCRDLNANLILWRWLLWDLPAKVIRRLVDPDGWTVRVYEVHRWPSLRPERLLLKEHLQGSSAAERRIEDVADSLTDGSLVLH
jgi:hypothetical protein